MMELGRSARTLRATGSRCATPRSQRREDGSPPCSLSAISGWRDGVFFIPWRGVPTIPARRISTGSGRRLAASPVLFREIVVFFLASPRSFFAKSSCSFSPMMELGRSARTLRATGSRCATPRFATARRWVSAVLSLRHFRLARWCVLYPLAGGADDSGAAHLDRLGPPAGRVAGSF